MAVVTIISDYGNKDHYVAALKGALLCQNDAINIVDITHDIPLFNIKEASYNLKNAFYHFPEGTIHLLCVDEESEKDLDLMIVLFEGHYFIGLNNGLPSLIVESRLDYEVYVVDDKLVKEQQCLSEVYAKVVGHLLRGGKPSILGRKSNALKQVTTPNPRVEGNKASIIGTIQYIDNFGNLVTNIHRKLFYEIAGTREYQISIPRERSIIKKVFSLYKEINHKGNLSAVFNSEGWLEIAIYKPISQKNNSAHSLMGMEIEDTVTVKFI